MVFTSSNSIGNFPGLKVTCAPRFANKPKEKSEGIKYLAKDKKKRQGIGDDRSKVSWNQNSGAASITLARHLGVKRIVLLGFDMQLGVGQAAHWHKGHGSPKPPPFRKHLMGWESIARDAQVGNIEIVNANPDSMIEVFPKVTVESLL